MANTAQVRIYAKYKRYDFDYSYKNNFTFLDLLEYFSYLFPELRICQCFGFQTKNNSNNQIYSNYFNKTKNNYIQIENDYLISRYSQYLLNLELNDKKKYCSHSYNNYLTYSKTKIISLLEGEISNLKNNNNAQTEKIKNLNKEKWEKEMKINDLNKEKKDQEMKINDLNKEKREKEMKINDLNKEKREKEMKINDLNKEKKDQEMKINDLNREKREKEMKINDLNKEKKRTGKKNK